MAELTSITAEEIRRAEKRVGDSDRARMRWAIEDFVGRDLDELTEGDWLNLEHEFFAFAIQPIGFGGLRGWDRVNRQILPPSKEELREIQTVWQRLVTKVREAPEGTGIQIARLRVSVLVRRHATGGAVDLRIGGGAHWEQIATPKFILLMGLAYLIRDCKECKRLFMAARLKQKFCSRRCKTRVTVRTFRQTHAVKKRSGK